MGAVEAPDCGLSPLTPKYEKEHHGSYVDYLLKTITSAHSVRNIALAGAYGTGKSSILQGVKENLPSDGVRQERWTPFLDRLPLVLKCYHASNGAEPATQSAGAGDDSSAIGWFCW